MQLSYRINAAIMVTLVLFMTACSNLPVVTPKGDIMTKTIELPEFGSLKISGSLNYEIVNGKQQVQISTFENIFEYLKTEVKDGALIVKTENVNFTKDPKITVYVSSDMVENIFTSGSSDLKLKNYKISALNISSSGSCDVDGSLVGNLYITSSGSSDIDLKVESKIIELKSNGSGDFKLSGITDSISVQTSGSSDVKAFDLVAQYASIRSNGSSDVNVNVLQSLSVDISGSGDVRYKGSPEVKTVNLAGSATLKKVE